MNSLGFGVWGISFTTPNNAGSTEYNVTKVVTNNTGVAWDSYEVFFGPGSLFDPGASAANSFPLELDADSAPSISGLGTGGATYVNFGGDYFRWDGLIGAGLVGLGFSRRRRQASTSRRPAA